LISTDSQTIADYNEGTPWPQHLQSLSPAVHPELDERVQRQSPRKDAPLPSGISILTVHLLPLKRSPTNTLWRHLDSASMSQKLLNLPVPLPRADLRLALLAGLFMLQELCEVNRLEILTMPVGTSF
jgi:hypothetical protein